MAYIEHGNFILIAEALKALGASVNEMTQSIEELSIAMDSQLRPETPEKAETPKRKKALEILPRIDISEEFLNLKINN